MGIDGLVKYGCSTPHQSHGARYTRAFSHWAPAAVVTQGKGKLRTESRRR